MSKKPFNSTDKNVLKSPMNVAQIAAKPFIGENSNGSKPDSVEEDNSSKNTSTNTLSSGAKNNETATKLVENANKNSTLGDVEDKSTMPETNIKQVSLSGNQSKPVSTLGNVLTSTNQPKNNKTKTNRNMKNVNKMTKTNLSSANNDTAKDTETDTSNDDTTKDNETDTANDNTETNDTDDTNTNKGVNTNNGNKKQLDTLNQISINMFNHYIAMKLYHFQTQNYSSHKTSDTYIEKYLSLMDRFLEVAQGIYGKVNLKKYDIKGSSHTDDNIINHINGFIKYISTGMQDVLDNKSDLLTVRDELLAEANQLKYLLTFN